MEAEEEEEEEEEEVVNKYWEASCQSLNYEWFILRNTDLEWDTNRLSIAAYLNIDKYLIVREI